MFFPLFLLWQVLLKLLHEAIGIGHALRLCGSFLGHLLDEFVAVLVEVVTSPDEEDYGNQADECPEEASDGAPFIPTVHPSQIHDDRVEFFVGGEGG